MTKAEAESLLPIFQAFAAGETIEVMSATGIWQAINDINFALNPKCYRIKAKLREFWIYGGMAYSSHTAAYNSAQVDQHGVGQIIHVKEVA